MRAFDPVAIPTQYVVDWDTATAAFSRALVALTTEILHGPGVLSRWVPVYEGRVSGAWHTEAEARSALERAHAEHQRPAER